MIVVDTLRADRLGCYGYRRPTSPAMDNLAEQGVLFCETFSPGSDTFVVLPSLLTSLYPDVLGTWRFRKRRFSGVPTLASVFGERGYETAAFLGPNLTAFSDMGFRSCDVTQTRHTAPHVTHKAIKWLGENRAKPFFLFLHYFDVHSPYEQPLSCRGLWESALEDASWKKLADRAFTKSRVSLTHVSCDKTTPPLLDYVSAHYDAGIKYTDDHLRILFERLDAQGLTDKTLVVLLADHGEEFCEHGSFFHGLTFYDEITHVPLVMRLPGVLPKGMRVHNLASLVDVGPTVLEILGIGKKDTMQGRVLSFENEEDNGRPVFSSNDPGGMKHFPKHMTTENWRFTESGPYCGLTLYKLYDLENDLEQKQNVAWKHPRLLNGFRRELQKIRRETGRYHRCAVRTSTLKLLEQCDFDGRMRTYELYDLKSDPKETRNVCAQRPDIVAELKKKLADHAAACNRMRISIGDGRYEKISRQAEERLKSLGYV